MSKAFGQLSITDVTDDAVESIEVYYALSQTNTQPSKANFTTGVKQVTSTNKYLWSYQEITYKNFGKFETPIVIVGVYGDTGAIGVGISSVTPLYYCSNSSTVPSAPSSAVTTNNASSYNVWNKAIATWTTTYKYYYTCNEVLYTNNSRKWTTPVVDNALTTANQNAHNATTNVQSVTESINNIEKTINGQKETIGEITTTLDLKADSSDIVNIEERLVEIEKYPDSISSTVSEVYATRDELSESLDDYAKTGDLKEKFSSYDSKFSEITQTSELVSIQISASSKKADEIQNLINKYFDFREDGLIIKGDGILSLRLDDNGLHIYSGETEITNYIDQGFESEKGVIKQSLQIGDWVFSEHPNGDGGLSFGKVGM